MVEIRQLPLHIQLVAQSLLCQHQPEPDFLLLVGLKPWIYQVQR
jgi:hypothetical protein